MTPRTAIGTVYERPGSGYYRTVGDIEIVEVAALPACPSTDSKGRCRSPDNTIKFLAPPVTGMSTTTKVAIAAGVGVLALFLVTRRRRR